MSTSASDRLRRSEGGWVLDGSWSIRVDTELQNGRQVVTSLEISLLSGKSAPEGGLTGRDLRVLSPVLLATEAGKGRIPKATRLIDRLAKRIKAEESVGQGRPRTEEFHAAIAELYIACLSLSPRSPVARMTQELKSRKVRCDRQAVGSWLQLSREKEWLTPGSRGYAGAQHGPAFEERPDLRLLGQELTMGELRG